MYSTIFEFRSDRIMYFTFTFLSAYTYTCDIQTFFYFNSLGRPNIKRNL